jgi:tricarballylate dehydrogenase
VNKDARMLMQDGKPAANMFAAGQIMAGIDMTHGRRCGRIAGREAAADARN